MRAAHVAGQAFSCQSDLHVDIFPANPALACAAAGNVKASFEPAGKADNNFDYSCLDDNPLQ